MKILYRERFLFFIATLVIGAIFLLSPKAHAASTTGSYLTTSPISDNITILPGQRGSTTLEVQNNSSVSETITVKLDKFTPNGDLGEANITTPSVTDPSVSWVHFSTTSFVAQPGVWNTITMTINVPNYASLGYYYAVLFIPKSSQTAPTTSDQIRGANAIFVLMDTNSSNEQRQLTLTSFSSTSGLYQFLPATFQIKVKNNGNINLIPQGDVYISRSPNGKVIDTIDVNSGLGNVLPDSSRLFSASWVDGLPAFVNKLVGGQTITNKKGQSIKQLDWNFSEPISKFRFGKYYAHLVLVYNNGNHDIPINAYLSFWVIPWKLILIIIIVIVAIIFSWKTIRKIVKQTFSRHKKQNFKN
jgi:hypothetical protein